MTVRPQEDRCLMNPLRLYDVCRILYKSIITCLEEMNGKELHTRGRTYSYSLARIVRPVRGDEISSYTEESMMAFFSPTDCWLL